MWLAKSLNSLLIAFIANFSYPFTKLSLVVWIVLPKLGLREVVYYCNIRAVVIKDLLLYSPNLFQ